MKYTSLFVASVLANTDQLEAAKNGYPREAIVNSPNPNNSTGITAAASDHVDCLKNGHHICIKRSDGEKSCVATGDAILSDVGYICTDKYTDNIYKYTMTNTALEEGEKCPESVEFSMKGQIS